MCQNFLRLSEYSMGAIDWTDWINEVVTEVDTTLQEERITSSNLCKA